jgi:hypothetical protein
VRGLHFFDGQDLSVEMEELHMRVFRVEDEHATEAGELSALVVEGSNDLVDLRMLPICDVPQLAKTTEEVFKATGLILEHL